MALVGPPGGGNFSPIWGLASGPSRVEPGLAEPSQEELSGAGPSQGRAKPSHLQATPRWAEPGRAELSPAEPAEAGPRGGHAAPTPNICPHAETTQPGVDGWGRTAGLGRPQVDYKQTWHRKFYPAGKFTGAPYHPEGGNISLIPGTAPRPGRTEPGWAEPSQAEPSHARPSNAEASQAVPGPGQAGASRAEPSRGSGSGATRGRRGSNIEYFPPPSPRRK